MTERTAAVEAVVDNLMTTSDGGSETELTEAELSSAAESSDAELEDDAEDSVVTALLRRESGSKTIIFPRPSSRTVTEPGTRYHRVRVVRE